MLVSFNTPKRKKHISVLIKPASSLCNLRCKYCFYANISSMREVRSYGRMRLGLVDQLVSQIFLDLVDGDEVTFAFQGGEPTLAGLRYYNHFIETVHAQSKNITVHYAIQTNGIIINDDWCKMLKSNNFLVGLSIDGLPIYHDLNRTDVHGRGTFTRVLATKKLFDKYNIDYNVLCVLTEQLANHPEKVYNFFKNQRVQFLQFIPCMDELTNIDDRSQYALTPEHFANFYRTLFRLWLNDVQKGHYQSIKLFDDINNQLIYGRITACGLNGKCSVHYVIEADGSVYPCDFYALDKFRMGYIQQETLRELFSKPLPHAWLTQTRELPQFCANCPFKEMCCGGCKRQSDAMYVNKQGNFCGYQSLLQEYLPQAKQIALRLTKSEPIFS